MNEIKFKKMVNEKGYKYIYDQFVENNINLTDEQVHTTIMSIVYGYHSQKYTDPRQILTDLKEYLEKNKTLRKKAILKIIGSEEIK